MRRRSFPNESIDYRSARDELLRAEAALRQQIEAVAALRRQLPLGGPVEKDYSFEEMDSGSEVRRVRLSELFAPGKSSLFLYGFMFGPNMKKACPLCTSMIDGLEGNAPHISQRINLAIVARSPIRRIQDFADSRGWTNLRFLSSASNTFQYDYLAEDEEGHQWPMANVFVKRDDRVHHFWGSELLFHEFEGGDMRHVDLLWPLWNILDLTPEGRGKTWYPSLTYDE